MSKRPLVLSPERPPPIIADLDQRPENVSPATALMDIFKKIEAMRIQHDSIACIDGQKEAGRRGGL